MPVEPATPDELEALTAVIDCWTAKQLDENDTVLAVDHDRAERRWYVRLQGEEKSVTTIWLTLRERTLHYETYFMPAPEEHLEATYEYLLRANLKLFGMRFAIGWENAIFLVGQVPVTGVDEDELDRIVGATYAYCEQHFRPAMRLGYTSKFSA